MEAREYKEIKKKLCKELEEVAGGNSFGMAEIEIIDKLLHSIKSINGIIETEGEGYSQGYYSREGGNSNNSYGNSYTGNSYNDSGYSGRRGMHYVRGHYSRGNYGDGMSYSYADGMDNIISQMQEMLNDGNIPADQKSSIRKAMDMIQH